MAPVEVTVNLPAEFVPGERVGNVDKNVAKILSSFMDADSKDLLESEQYDIGYSFTCILTEDTHHRADGYGINIVVCSLNSDSWCDKMFTSLYLKGLNPHKLY